MLVLVGVEKPAEAAVRGLYRKIAVTSDRDGDSEIYVMSADATNRTNITNDPNSDAWSSGCLSSRKRTATGSVHASTQRTPDCSQCAQNPIDEPIDFRPLYCPWPRFPHPLVARSSLCTLDALRGVVCGATMTIPGGAGTPRSKALLQLPPCSAHRLLS